MWESPINVMEIQDSFVSEIKEKTEEMVFTEIKRIGIDVNKEELIKALQYDRNQYEKGYADAIDDFAERLRNMATNNEYGIYAVLSPREIDEIAEELKGGAE